MKEQTTLKTIWNFLKLRVDTIWIRHLVIDRTNKTFEINDYGHYLTLSDENGIKYGFRFL